MEENVYYVYVYFRRNGEPFYVGKGKGSRYKDHLRAVKKQQHWNVYFARVLAKEGVDAPVVIIRDGLSEQEAFAVEGALIRAIGRAANGGPLTNMTDGGEGISGYRHTEDAREASRQRMLGDKRNLGLRRSDETKLLLRAAKLGKKHSPEFVERRVAPLRGRKRPNNEVERIRATRLAEFAGPRGTELRARRCGRWITDGTKNSRIPPDAVLPIGWRYGRSGDFAAKISATLKTNSAASVRASAAR